MKKDIINKLRKLRAEIIIKGFYKNLEKAPSHLLLEYWSQKEPIFSKIKNDNI